MARLCDEIRGDGVHGRAACVDVYRNARVLRPSLLPPLAARATEEKNRFDGGDGVEEASNAVAAVETRERHAAGAILHGPWPN